MRGGLVTYVCLDACTACWRYNQLIVALAHIKHVHSIVSYQLVIYQKYDRRGHPLPSGYGAY